MEIELENLSSDLFAKGVIHRSHDAKPTPLGIKTGSYETHKEYPSRNRIFFFQLSGNEGRALEAKLGEILRAFSQLFVWHFAFGVFLLFDCVLWCVFLGGGVR